MARRCQVHAVVMRRPSLALLSWHLSRRRRPVFLLFAWRLIESLSRLTPLVHKVIPGDRRAGRHSARYLLFQYDGINHLPFDLGTAASSSPESIACHSVWDLPF